MNIYLLNKQEEKKYYDDIQSEYQILEL